MGFYIRNKGVPFFLIKLNNFSLVQTIIICVGGFCAGGAGGLGDDSFCFNYRPSIQLFIKRQANSSFKF